MDVAYRDWKPGRRPSPPGHQPDPRCRSDHAQSMGKGGVHIDLLYDEGGFRKLAEYLSKTPDEENKMKESRYSCSKNLKIPVAEEKVYKRKTWSDEPKPPKGYYLDKETYHEGINPVTGYKYRRYILIRLNRRI